jgi:hypothetical protein
VFRLGEIRSGSSHVVFRLGEIRLGEIRSGSSHVVFRLGEIRSGSSHVDPKP